MKPKFRSIWQFSVIVIAASNLCVISTVCAVEDTSTATNPHLRSTSSIPGASTVVKLSQKDASFIQKASGGGQQEVENGKMAEKQGKSADVKRIGARMVADHTKANKELLDLANRKGVKVDTRGVRAQNIGAADFDRTYLKLLEVDHKSDIADFEKEAKNGDDRDLKLWAAKTLPMLKEHLAMVEDAMRKVK